LAGHLWRPVIHLDPNHRPEVPHDHREAVAAWRTALVANSETSKSMSPPTRGSRCQVASRRAMIRRRIGMLASSGGSQVRASRVARLAGPIRLAPRRQIRPPAS
jgi:hypothetical protein